MKISLGSQIKVGLDIGSSAVYISLVQGSEHNSKVLKLRCNEVRTGPQYVDIGQFPWPSDATFR